MLIEIQRRWGHRLALKHNVIVYHICQLSGSPQLVPDLRLAACACLRATRVTPKVRLHLCCVWYTRPHLLQVPRMSDLRAETRTEMSADIQPEPTFIRVSDNAAVTSLRRSGYSNRSRASNRSWVYSNQNSLAPPNALQIDPEGQSPSTTPRLRPMNPDILASRDNNSDDEEFMTVNPHVSTYPQQQQHPSYIPPPPIPSHPAPEEKPKQQTSRNGFVGGFVNGLRRLPRALVRNRKPIKRKGTVTSGEGLDEAANPLPVYVTTPPTPILDQGVGESSTAFTRMPEGLPETLIPGRTSSIRRIPSAHLSPPPLPEEDETSTQRHSGVPPTMIPLPSSPQPTLRPTPHEPAVFPDTPPLARPQQAEDYRRMSKVYTSHASHTSRTLSSSGQSSPSFDSELNGIQGFLSTFGKLPWVAQERVTTDYQPGWDRGAWGWKRVSVRLSNGRPKVVGNRPVKKTIWSPIQKPKRSWYNRLSAPSIPPSEKAPTWVGSPIGQAQVLDMLSSGGGTSVLSASIATSPILPSPRSPRSPRRVRSPEPRRHEAEVAGSPKRSGQGRFRNRRRRHSTTGRHHRREPNSPSPPRESTPAPTPFSPYAQYPHGYAPGGQYQYNTSLGIPPPLPLSPVVPHVLPQTPVYMYPSQPGAETDNRPNPDPNGSPLGQSMSYVPTMYMPVVLHSPPTSNAGTEGTPPIQGRLELAITTPPPGYLTYTPPGAYPPNGR